MTKIKIPIKTIVNNDLYIPISLNYHAIGIKVEEEATVVLLDASYQLPVTVDANYLKLSTGA